MRSRREAPMDELAHPCWLCESPVRSIELRCPSCGMANPQHDPYATIGMPTEAAPPPIGSGGTSVFEVDELSFSDDDIEEVVCELAEIDEPSSPAGVEVVEEAVGHGGVIEGVLEARHRGAIENQVTHPAPGRAATLAVEVRRLGRRRWSRVVPEVPAEGVSLRLRRRPEGVAAGAGSFRIEPGPGLAWITARGTPEVYRRIGEATRLVDGARLRLGRHVYEFRERRRSTELMYAFGRSGDDGRNLPPHLVEIEPSGAEGRRFALAEGPTTVGRDGPHCDIAVPGDTLVSARHLEIRDGGEDGFEVRDLGTINGTFVAFPGRVAVEPGEVVVVGWEAVRVVLL